MKAVATQSTMQKSINLRRSIAEQDAQVQKAQKEVATGLREDVYADTGFRAAQSLDLRNRMARVEQYHTSNSLLNGKLDIVSGQMAAMRGKGNDLMTMMVAFGSGRQGLDTLQTEAIATFNAVNSMVNTTYAGEYLFSGIGSNNTSQTLDLAGFPGFAFDGASSLADIDQALADLDGFFGLNGAIPSATGYDSKQDYSGTIQKANLDETSVLQLGLTAKDDAFKQIFKGMVMFAATDATKIGDDAAYKKWLDEAIGAIQKGTSELERYEATLGNQQSLIKDTLARQENLKTIYNNRIVDIEGVDAYEAGLRMESMTKQLETSYAVTARLKNLSLLNYL